MFIAASTLRPRISAATRFSFCAEPRICVPTESASLSATRRGDFSLPISVCPSCQPRGRGRSASARIHPASCRPCLRRSEEHTSELQSLMRISYAVFCLKKKKTKHNEKEIITHQTRYKKLKH